MNNKITFLAISLLQILVLSHADAQCNVEKGTLNNGNLFYAHGKEVIYQNDDLEYGSLVALVRLVVIQSSTDKVMLQFKMLIDVGRSGSKQMVVPRKISIQFTDNSTLSLDAESMQAPSQIKSLFFEHSTFRLQLDSFSTLQGKSIQKITITDHRKNKELICQPYKDILLEQANCIILQVEE